MFKGVITITDSTLSANVAVDNGGAIYVGGDMGSASFSNVTVSDNSAQRQGGSVFAEAPATFRSSILANSLAGEECAWDTISVIRTPGYNIVSHDSCQFRGPGDLNRTDPLFDRLADNGGSTVTHTLFPGGPAIDSAYGCGRSDRRNLTRPVDGWRRNCHL